MSKQGVKKIYNSLRQSAHVLWLMKHRRPIIGPLRAIILASNSCNARCGFCSRWEFYEKSAHLEVKAGVFKPVIKQMSDMGLVSLSLTGGEPLVYPDLWDIISYAGAQGISALTMTTNGFLIDKYLKEITESGLTDLYISIDTLDPERYRKFRGVDMLGRVMENVRALIDYKRKRFSNKPRLFINSIVSSENYHELPGLCAFARSAGVNGFSFGPLADIPQTNISIKDPDLREQFENTNRNNRAINEVIEKVVKENKDFLVNSEEFNLGIPGYMSNPAGMLKIECWAGRITVKLDSLGNVYPCCSWHNPVGNIKEKSFRDIWFSDEFDRARGEIIQGRHPPCWMACYVAANLKLGRFGKDPLGLIRYGMKKLFHE